MSTSIGWRLIGRNMAVHKGALARALLWSAVGSLPALLSGLLIAAALNHGFLVGDTTVGLACLGALIPLFGLSAFATCRLFPWCAEVVEGVRDNLVTTVAAGAIASSTEFVASGGRHVARCVEQVEVVRNLLAALSRSLRQMVMPIVAALIGLAVLSPILAAVVAPPVLLSMALYVRVVRQVAARQRAGAIADEQLAEQAAAVFAGMRDVTAHGAGEWATARLVGAAKTSAAATSAVAKANTTRALVVALGAQLPLLAVLGVAAVLVPDGRLSIGAAVGAVTYVTTALAPALRTMVHSGGGWLVQLGVLTSRIAETAADVPPNEPTEATEPTDPVDRVDPVDPVDPVDLRAAVAPATATERIPTMALATHGLRFRYGAGADDVVNGLDLLVPAGDHLAIVGPSGGGKSTLALLLAAVLTPTEGRVSLDGRPLQEWAPAERHRALAVIPQQAYVFAGTVQENLTYLRPAATTQQVEQAVTAFGLGATVQRLGGLDAVMPAGGQALSAGERQSVALARAWLSAASVVVLDEATCHLDSAAEARGRSSLPGAGREPRRYRPPFRFRPTRPSSADGRRPVMGARHP